VFAQQVVVLGNVPVVEICDPEVKQDVEKKGEVEDHEIKAELRRADGILNGPVDPEDPERLDQQVKEKEEAEVGKKFPLHVQENSGNILIFATKLQKYHFCLPEKDFFSAVQVLVMLHEDRRKYPSAAEGQTRRDRVVHL
jgi:hypothetical protein